MKPVLIVCLGNPLMKDEGIGIRIAQILVQKLAENPVADILDLGTGGLSVLHAINGREKVIFIDCALMGLQPGEIKRFRPGDVCSNKFGMRYSLHEGDLLNTLQLSRNMGECPEDIIIFGIEPKEIADGQVLSSELEQNIDHYVQSILDELG